MWVIVEFDGELEGLPGHVWGPFATEASAREARTEMQMEANDDYPIYEISEPPNYVKKHMVPTMKVEGNAGSYPTISFTAIIQTQETTSE